MQYKVTKQYARGADILFAQFADMNDATFFIEHKLAADAALNVKVTYRIFEINDLLKEFNPEDASLNSGSNQGGRGASFTPTPFNTAPQPSGVPHKWYKDDDTEEKN